MPIKMTQAIHTAQGRLETLAYTPGGLSLIRAVRIETWHPGPVRGSAQQVGEAWEQGQGGEHHKSHTYGSHRFQRAIGTQIAEQQAQQAGDHGAAGSEDRLQDTAQSGPGGFRSRFVAP